MPTFPRLSAPGLAALVLLFNLAPAAAGPDPREAIGVVSGATAFPLAVAAAEQFSLKRGRAMPVVERAGAGDTFALFCAGLGARFPDVATAARRMTRAELGACRRKGIAVSEARLGFQAVALGQAPDAAPLGLSLRQIFLALARQVPIDGKLVDNPYRLWSDIDFALPVKPIEVYGPPPGSPLRDAFVALVMEPAAAVFPELRGWTPVQRAALAGALRDDGAFDALGEDEAETAARLARRPAALGVFSFNFLARQGAGLRGVSVDGVPPRHRSIADGRYAPARPLYLYVKPAQAKDTPGLEEFLGEFLGPAAAGPGGYLTARGLVPLPAAEAAGLTPLGN